MKEIEILEAMMLSDSEEPDLKEINALEERQEKYLQQALGQGPALRLTVSSGASQADPFLFISVR